MGDGLAGSVDAEHPAGVPDVGTGESAASIATSIAELRRRLRPVAEEPIRPYRVVMRRSVGVIAVLGLVLTACSWPQFRGDGRHAGVNPFAPGLDSGTVATLVPAWTNTITSVSGGEVVTIDGRAIAGSSAAVYGFDLATGAAQWHVDRTLTSPLYQFKSLGETTTIGTGGTARVVMSEFEAGFDPQNPALFAYDGFTRWIDPASGTVAASIAEGGRTAPPEADGWVYYPRERGNSGIHGTQNHVLVADAPGADPDFTVSLPNAGITEVVSDGTTTFAVDSGVALAIPGEGLRPGQLSNQLVDEPDPSSGSGRRHTVRV